jgi:hypothetical protein
MVERAPRRHLELCRATVGRIVPGESNATRLAYTAGICQPPSLQSSAAAQQQGWGLATVRIGLTGNAASVKISTNINALEPSDGATVRSAASGGTPGGGGGGGGGGGAAGSIGVYEEGGRIDWSLMPPSLDPAAEGEDGTTSLIENSHSRGTEDTPIPLHAL